MFLSRELHVHRNTRESLGELEIAVETLDCSSCSHSISRSPKLLLVFYKLDRNTVHVWYFLRYQPGLKKANFRNFQFRNVQIKPLKSFLFKKIPQKNLFQCKVIGR